MPNPATDADMIKEANLLLQNIKTISRQNIHTRHSPSRPSSPACKRWRKEQLRQREVNTSTQTLAVIPAQYSPITTPSSNINTDVLFTYQSRFDKKPFMRPVIPLIFDTGASITISNSKHDFVGSIHAVQHAEIQGIA
jgi:hypothetical protein